MYMLPNVNTPFPLLPLCDWYELVSRGHLLWSYKKHCNSLITYHTKLVVSYINTSWTTEHDGVHGKSTRSHSERKHMLYRLTGQPLYMPKNPFLRNMFSSLTSSMFEEKLFKKYRKSSSTTLIEGETYPNLLVAPTQMSTWKSLVVFKLFWKPLIFIFSFVLFKNKNNTSCI